MKVCKDCNKPKPYTDFFRDSTMADGYWSRCKRCEKLRIANPHTFVKIMYRSQVSSSVRRNHALPNYTQDELYNWLIQQPNYLSLFNKYKQTLKRLDAPSIDRLDDYLPYTLDNIRLITWKENKEKYHSDAKKGINNKLASEVQKHDAEGNLLVTYHSVTYAAKQEKVSRTSIRNYIKRGSCPNGYTWSYLTFK